MQPPPRAKRPQPTAPSDPSDIDGDRKVITIRQRRPTVREGGWSPVDATHPHELVGGRINYEDRVLWENPAGFTFEIARVTLTTGDDSGMVMGQVR